MYCRDSWKVHTPIIVGSKTGIKSATGSSFCTWSLGGGIVLLSASMMSKLYLVVVAGADVTVTVVTGNIVAADIALCVVTGIANVLTVTGIVTGFLLLTSLWT